MKKITLFLALIILPVLLQSQVLTQDWQSSKQLSANEHIHEAIESTNGLIIAVGYTESYPGTKRDSFCQRIDNRSGQIIRSKNLGGGPGWRITWCRPDQQCPIYSGWYDRIR